MGVKFFLISIVAKSLGLQVAMERYSVLTLKNALGLLPYN